MSRTNTDETSSSGWFSGVLNTAYSLLAYLPSSLTASPYDLDAAAACQKFVREYELEYGNVHPRFIEASYQQATQRAKSEFKFLIVYLHSAYHENTADFCRNTLSTELMSEFLDEHFLCWGSDIRMSEGYKLSNWLMASTYPFLGVICNNNIGGVTLVDRIEGPITPEDLMARLTNVLENHGAVLTAARVEQEERNMDQLLREEQEQAFQESLAADQAKERRLQEALEREREEREALEREESLRQSRLMDKERRREELANSLPSEPEATDSRAARLVVRLPDGSRLQRRFHYDDTLDVVYNFIDVNRTDLPDYQLVMSYPRTVFADRSITLEAAGLIPQSSLFVEEK